MPVTMICPNLKCGRAISAPDAARGKVVRCAHCKQLLMVPAQPAALADAGDAGKKKK